MRKILLSTIAMAGLLGLTGHAAAFDVLSVDEMDSVTAGASSTAKTDITFLALAQSGDDATCANHNCNTSAAVQGYAVTTVDTSSESSGRVYLTSETIQAN